MKITYLIKGLSNKAEGVVHELAIGKSSCVIGRKAAGLTVSDKKCSKIHAALVITAERRLEVRDLGSRNGTYVNGKRVEKQVLRPQDQIRIGGVVLTIVSLSYSGEAKADDTEIVVSSWPELWQGIPGERRQEFETYHKVAA